MHEDKDPGRLLLLRFRVASVKAESRLQLRQHGPPDDRGHKVSGGGVLSMLHLHVLL